MRVPVGWLLALVEAEATVEELADRLPRQGLAVEALEWLGRGLEGVWCARVDGLGRHPHADGLWVAEVDAGGRRVQVVTGAGNLAVGDRVPWIEPGGRLPGGERIGRREFRGVVSEGMLLSAQEMGLGPDAAGIFVLDPASPVGADVNALLGLPEAVLELELTPNMAVHCQSVAGVAREVAAAYGAPLRLPPTPPPPTGPLPVAVAVEDAADCPRYALGLVAWPEAGGAAVPSPAWMRRRLLAAGARLNGLAVDVTNYVMLELGQPLHAFDLDRVRGGRIGVRRAHPGERLTTLDGEARVLGPEQLVIADAEGAIGLAGVMGGRESEVTAGTRRVLFEAAAFDPRRVRRGGRALGLASEAQARFEKGVDVSAVSDALGRALALCAEADPRAAVHPGSVDVGPGAGARPRALVLRPERVRALLGAPIDDGEVVQALTRLGFGVLDGPGGTLRVEVPVRRSDVEGEADLAEEVGRLVGYDRLPARLPRGESLPGLPDPARVWQEALADAMAAQGLTEVVTTSLVGSAELGRLGFDLERCVRLANPLGPDADVLRPSLLPGLLRALRANLERGREGVWLFERGTVTERADPGADWPFSERQALAALARGPRQGPDWRRPPEEADFFALKGVLGHLLRDAYGPEGDGWRPRRLEGERGWGARLHPGRAAAIDAGGRTVAVLGELHPALAAALDLAGPVIYFEWWHGNGPAPRQRASAPPPRFPAVSRDVAVILSDAVPAAAAIEGVRAAGGPWLEEVRLFDVYRGPGIPAGTRSLALRLRYRAPDRTLREDEVEPVHQAVREALAALGGTLRS